MKVSSGTLDVYENYKTDRVSPRTVRVWVPDGYSKEKKYAVLYMHDGAALFDSSTTWNGQEWDVDGKISELLSMHKIRDCIVVGIDNGGKFRHTDYTPQKVYDKIPELYKDYLNTMENLDGSPKMVGEVRSDDYLKFIVKELKPFIDEKYSTLRDRDNTIIMGSSMGALISIYAICEYPDVFGAAGCLSTHWTVSFTDNDNPVPGITANYLKENLPDPSNHKIYFDYGTETLDSLYEPYQLAIDEVMKDKGYTEENWMTKKFPGAKHDERSWRIRLQEPLEFLLGK